MAHTTKDKDKLILRVHRIRGQIDSVERALESEQGCSEVLHLIITVRGAVNSLIAELLEGHIRCHVLDPKVKPKPQQEIAADELVELIKSYLK
jgi:DNA-binding FrmR family transcriptional regulator